MLLQRTQTYPQAQHECSAWMYIQADCPYIGNKNK